MATTKRIELSDGNWAEVRTSLTVADLRHQRQVAHDRGFDDEVLDGIEMIRRGVVSWSFGEVNDDVLDALPMADMERLAQEFSSGEASSTGSSAGGNSKKASRPSNG